MSSPDAQAAHTPLTAGTEADAARQAVEAALGEAERACESANWDQVIAACEAAIAHSKQCLQIAERSSTPPAAPEPSPATSSAGQTTGVLYQAKGDLFKKQGNFAAAIGAYQQALALNPKLTHVKLALADTHLKESQRLSQQDKKETVGAVLACLQAIEQSPSLYSAYAFLRYNLMRYDLPSGDPVIEKVIDVCQSVVDANPDLRPAQITLGYALTKLGRVAEATEYFRVVSDRASWRYIQRAKPELDVDTLDIQRRAPDFMIIGAEKCGTTSLYQYLDQHPAVLSPIEKEIDFFDMEYDCGIDWYLAHFPAMPTQPGWITGETSPNYLYSGKVPGRVAQHFPNIQLIVILRNPVDRALSRYSMMVRNGSEQRSFEQVVDDEMHIIKQKTTDGHIPLSVLNQCRHLGNGLYYYHLQRWLLHFKKEQILVIRSESLFDAPEQALLPLYEVLGIRAIADQTYKKHNVGSYQAMSASLRQRLQSFFAPHTHKLEKLLSTSFEWYTDSKDTGGKKS